ncbi:MAG TPA: sigma-70 family RNA polymerase sigma factor [Kofleriaceae bacterium]
MVCWETLTAAFGPTSSDPALSGVLQGLYTAGRVRWAELPALPPEDFVAHLALRVPPDVDPVAHLRGLVAEDLYLACACTCGIPDAVKAFDAQFLSRVPDYVSHIGGSSDFGQEIQQQLRERLLVRRGDAPPRIADYSGRGSLASWLRVAAVRVALNHRVRPNEARRVDDEAIVDELATEVSPQLDVLRARYAAVLGDALKRAVAGLRPDQRVLLRMYFVSGHSTQQIATLLRVDRSTAARRLVAARQAVFDETHRWLRTELAIDSSEFASLARTLHDQLNVSLGGLLADSPEG